MLYRVELMQNKRLIFSDTMNCSHPGQCLRKLTERQSVRPAYAQSYIMNEDGEVWVYNLVARGRQTVIQPHSKSNDMLPRHIVIEVLSGNKTISEAVNS